VSIVTKPHFSAPAGELSSKIASVRALGKQLEHALSEVDAEVIALREEIHQVQTAPVSRQEFCEYAMRSMLDQAAEWQAEADAAIKRAAHASVMTAIIGPASIDGNGDLQFSRSTPQRTCPVAPGKYRSTETDLAYTAWDPRTATPAVAWLAILGEPFERAVRDWLMARAKAIGLPEKTSIPLSDRPARMDELNARLVGLMADRKALVKEIGELRFSISDRPPGLPHDAHLHSADDERGAARPSRESRPTVCTVAEDGTRIPVGHERWIATAGEAQQPDEFDAWLKRESAENAEAADLLAQGWL